MADEEESGPVYTYQGARAEGETQEVTAGEDPKILTQTVTLLGAREGEGSATFPNGDTYAGSFSSGVRSGTGRFSYASPPPAEEGDEQKPPVAGYDGAWKDGLKSGVGVLTFSSGAKYHGNFTAGKYEGQGTMFYANGDVYTGEWKAGQKHGAGTYIHTAVSSRVSGMWVNNVLTEGTFSDKFGNAYKGAFAADATSAAFVPGAAFTLASGATATVPSAPAGPKWTVMPGVHATLSCASPEKASTAIGLVRAFLSEQVVTDAGAGPCAILGKLTPTPTPPYRSLPGVDANASCGWLELFESKEAMTVPTRNARKKGLMPKLLGCGATGSGSDFSVLETTMHTLEKPGFGSGGAYVVLICCEAKDAASATEMVEVAKGEVAANMVEPLFVRGTVMTPTAAEPLKVRWTVEWAVKDGLEAHKTFTHHKDAGPKLMKVVNFKGWGGALEYHEAYHFATK